MGEFLKAMPKNTGVRGSRLPNDERGAAPEPRSTLSEFEAAELERLEGVISKNIGAAMREMDENDEADRIAKKNGNRPATLAEIGITKKQSSRAQQLADIPAPEFAERVAVAKASGGKVSTARGPASAHRPPVAASACVSVPEGQRTCRETGPANRKESARGPRLRGVVLSVRWSPR